MSHETQRKRLTLLAPINSYTGYGLHAIQVARDLDKFGAYTSIRPIRAEESFGASIPADIRMKFVSGPQPEPWELLLYPPNMVPTPGKKTAYFTMWESSRLPATGVPVLNKAELVIVPCVWNATTFSASGVNVPIRVVPLGINTSIFNFRPLNPPYAVTGERELYVFGAAGRLAHGGVRKGLNEVIDLFQKAFPDNPDVRLRIKCYPDCPITKRDDPRIDYTAAHLSEQQLADWFSSLNCFVSAARGEGWGLMQMQAMAIGRPLISVNFGGVAEFFKPGTGYPVDYKLEPSKHLYAGCGVWAEPIEESFIAAMRRAYTVREEAFAFGSAAAEAVREFSWENANRKLAEVLREVGAL